MKTTQTWKIDKRGCLYLLPTIPDKSVDMILTDLPYGTTACSWDTLIDLKKLWPEYKRIIKNNGVIVLNASQPFTSVLIMSNLEMFKYEWIWNKVQPTGFSICKVQPLKQHEHILIFGKGNITYNPIMEKRNTPIDSRKWKQDKMHSENGKFDSIDLTKAQKIYTHKHPTSILTYNRAEKECNNTKRIHPTQKPVALYEYLIKTYTNIGGMVHDSCLGSGTTLEACKNLNRNCIGFEISNEWEPFYHKRLSPDSVELTNGKITGEYKNILNYFE